MAAVAAAVVAGLVTACSSTSASSTPVAGFGSPGAARSPASAGLAMCRTGDLRITVDNGQTSGAAGSTYYPLDLTNTTTAACTLDGYPDVSFVTAASGAGRQIGAAAVRDQEFGPVRVRLEPGGEAHAWLQVGTSGNFPASTCQPVTARGWRVYPPGETVPGYVQQDIPACAADGAQLLAIMPARSGKATAGTVP